MTRRGEVYKCLVCGIVVEVLDEGAGEPVCCGRPMALQPPHVDGPQAASHRPAVRLAGGRTEVRVGASPHPSDARHCIQWIEWRGGDASIIRRRMEPGASPEAVFDVEDPRATVRAFCNQHGLWEASCQMP
jgi:superoxide reductase